jgi:lysozyme
VTQLQLRLRELGDYDGPIDGQFGSATDAAARRFQSDVFGPAEADGLVGPMTWKALWEEPPGPQEDVAPAGEPGKTTLRLAKTDRRDHYGLTVLLLAYIKSGKVAGRLEVCSGAPGRQSFRRGRSVREAPSNLFRKDAGE